MAVKKISARKKYRDSDGNMYTQAEINIKINEAKAEVKQYFIDTYGYVPCSECLRNDCTPIEMSHTISIQEAKDTGRTELCWKFSNIKPRGRKCHAKLDKLYLGNA